MKDDDLSSSIPRKWGKLMTNRKVIQEEFERKLDQSRIRPEDLPDVDLNVGLDHEAEEISDRMQKIQDRNPAFLKDLAFLIEPLANKEDQQRDNTHSQRDKSFSDGTELKPVLEKNDKRPLSHMSRDKIQQTCKRYGLGRTWNDLLVMLNQVNSASSGKLFDKPNK